MSKLEQLIDTYPRLLRGTGPVIPGYIGAGWHPIVMRLMAGIDALLDDELAAGFRLIQVKEKFGGLRFYFDLNGRKDFTVDIFGVGRLRIPDQDKDGLPPRPAELDHINQLIRSAEEEASRTCEACGRPGELRKGGWVVTLCEHHARIKEAGGQPDFEDGT